MATTIAVGKLLQDLCLVVTQIINIELLVLVFSLGKERIKYSTCVALLISAV